MYISERHKFIFIHCMKTAGTSVRRCLRSGVPDLHPLLPQHAYAADGIERLGRDSWDKYYTFGFVRNPWARLVSWYAMYFETVNSPWRGAFWRYAREHATDFQQFLTNCQDTVIEQRGNFVLRRNLFKNQIDHFTDQAGKVAVSYIGRFESVEHDFALVQKKLGLSCGPLPVTNVSGGRAYQTYYNAYTRQIVAERYQKDIDYFGYTFDSTTH
jgi:chondroitin 4-sulfotransferase 11